MNFDAVRKIALAWPGVEEGSLHGAPTVKVSGRILAVSSRAKVSRGRKGDDLAT